MASSHKTSDDLQLVGEAKKKRFSFKSMFFSKSENHELTLSEPNTPESDASSVTSSKLAREKPDKSMVQLICMGMVYFGIELLFSLEIALTLPIMRKLGVSEKVFSYVYFLSPLLGFFFQPVLGILSDRCESKLGRRRPFILGLAISSLIGITFILNGHFFSDMAGGSEEKKKGVGIFLVALGVTLLDFSADSCDSPLRALVLDTCNSKDRDTGLNIHAFLGGSGAALGYVMAGVNWNHTFFNFIGDELQVLSVFATVMFVFALLLTMVSVREKRFKLNKSKPTNTTIENDEMKITVLGDISMTIIEKDSSTARSEPESPSAVECPPVDSEDEDEEPPIGFKTLFKSLRKMPDELIRLLICQVIGWLAFFSTTLFFTDFIAIAIYEGDSDAPSNSTEGLLYDEGVKMGSLCLLVFSVSSAVSAVLIEKILLHKLGSKILFLLTFATYSISCICIFFLHNVYAIMPFCASFGFLMTSLTTLPYEMVSDFHKDSVYCCKSAQGTKRGIGLDCAFLCSCFFLAQTIISVYMGYLEYVFGTRVILINGCLFGILGFIFVLVFVKFPKPKTDSSSSQ